MKRKGQPKPISPEMAAAAAELPRRITAAGLTIAEFQRRSGLTRNVVYHLSVGRTPRPEELKAIDKVLPPN